MSESRMILAGPLATDELCDVLGVAGQTLALPGRVCGGAQAGIGGDWPRYETAAGEVPAIEVAPTAALMRYLDVMGLHPQHIAGREVWGFGGGGGDDWSTAAAPLMALVAKLILERGTEREAAQVRARLRRIAEVAAAGLRIRTEPEATELLPEPDSSRVEVRSRHERYGRYFSVEEVELRHRRHDGSWSERLAREVFISADAALLLPYDPVRDEVLLISQFRVGPFARGQAQCWMLEPIAGRIDVGETPADAARREAVEEAGLSVGRLYALPGHYPTPGANSEYFYPFVATVDLSDYRAGQGFGLDDEGEDITTHVLPRAALLRLAMSGQLQCGPLFAMALWLDRQADAIRAGTQPEAGTMLA
ncbi:NUDIX domain-containing protein [Paracoccus aurantiacus]|uniref:ADP-ribose pyrophosphatase n=1 Tax=Paracoccus aurantiacus TaxID=2599412 RepID=A0A5C6SAX3_9RHOB|nr:NUDIX domain-containing protein [Paracoccus aurantiacus]TXB70933.1 NUDIX domain-containing protein [Paracoccus aurantiacus]